jgi:hypothetical protein
MLKNGHAGTRIIIFAEGSTCTGKPEVILDWREQADALLESIGDFATSKAYGDESVRQIDIYVLFLRFSTQ